MTTDPRDRTDEADDPEPADEGPAGSVGSGSAGGDATRGTAGMAAGQFGLEASAAGGREAETSLTRGGTYALVAVLHAVGFAAAFAGGMLFGSVALLGYGAALLLDALLFGSAFAATHVGARYDRSAGWSYWFHRLEAMAAFLNGVLLFPVIAYVLLVAVRNLFTVVPPVSLPTLVITGFGLAVSLGAVAALRATGLSPPDSGVSYYALGAVASGVVVFVTTIVVWVTDETTVDAAIAVLLAVVVAWSAANLLYGSGSAFLRRDTPSRAGVAEALRALHGVTGVQDLHVWQVCNVTAVVTARVEVDAGDVDEMEDVRGRVRTALADLGVVHATVELALSDGAAPDDADR